MRSEFAIPEEGRAADRSSKSHKTGRSGSSCGRALAFVGDEPESRSIREAVQKSACQRFTTVLGPGADSSHKDHLHLDMRERPRGFRICQWTVE
ncbi:extensin family protein [Bosea sp. 2KB_26]|uniref:extensin family protein n=1 Tax=Bosea sp. 2KB_26 TaxID=3237475 RepID=UPI003F8FA8B4